MAGLRLYKKDSGSMTIQEFDALTGTHTFSEAYEEKKRNILEGLEQSPKRTGGRWRKFAVAAAVAAVLAVPAAMFFTSPNAALAGASFVEFFDGLFGNSTKDDMAAHEADIGGGETVQVPSREYVPVTAEEAERLIGAYVNTQPVTAEIGDHTLTVEYSVYSAHGAQVYFTLERAEGVTLLTTNEINNPGKGASFAEDTPYRFSFVDRAGNPLPDSIYIDQEKSTAEKLYCYAYMVTDQAPDGLYLLVDNKEGAAAPSATQALREETLALMEAREAGTISPEEWDVKWADIQARADEEYAASQAAADKISLTEKDPVPAVLFSSETGDTLEVSSISMWMDVTKVPGLEHEPDPAAHIDRIEIRYTDGSRYVVEADGSEYVDNTGYRAGFEDYDAIAFNRLVDVDRVDSILVNNTVYRAR